MVEEEENVVSLALPSEDGYVAWRFKCDTASEAMRWEDALVQWRLHVKKQRVQKRGTLSPAAVATVRGRCFGCCL